MRALVTGANGQTGSYVVEKLLARGRTVVGLVRRRTHSRDVTNLDLAGATNRGTSANDRFSLRFGDVTQPETWADVFQYNTFDAVFHLADQDHVRDSVLTPGLSAATTYGATASLLEHVLRFSKKTLVFVPSSATIFGDDAPDATETTALRPMSPYAIAKAGVLHLARYYRDQGLGVTCGILYNHDSTRRKDDYLLHRVCRLAKTPETSEGALRLLAAIPTTYSLGHAADYADGMIDLILKAKPNDYVMSCDPPVSANELVRFVTGRNYHGPENIKNRVWGRSFRAFQAINWTPRPWQHTVAEVMREYGLYQKETV